MGTLGRLMGRLGGHWGDVGGGDVGTLGGSDRDIGGTLGRVTWGHWGDIGG